MLKWFRVCLLNMEFLFIYLQSYPLGKFVLKEASVIAQWAEPVWVYKIAWLKEWVGGHADLVWLTEVTTHHSIWEHTDYSD